MPRCVRHARLAHRAGPRVQRERPLQGFARCVSVARVEQLRPLHMQLRRQPRVFNVRLRHRREVRRELRVPPLTARARELRLEPLQGARVSRRARQRAFECGLHLGAILPGCAQEPRALRPPFRARRSPRRRRELRGLVREEHPLCAACVAEPSERRVRRRRLRRRQRALGVRRRIRDVTSQLVDQRPLEVRAGDRCAIGGQRGDTRGQSLVELFASRAGRRPRSLERREAIAYRLGARRHPGHLLRILVPDPHVPRALRRRAVGRLAPISGRSVREYAGLPRRRRLRREQIGEHDRDGDGVASAGISNVGVEGARQLVGARDPLHWIGIQRAAQHGRKCGRIVRDEGHRVRDVRGQHASDRLDVAVFAKQAPPQGGLPEGDAERKDVRSSIDRLARDLLGRQVRQLALHDADGRPADAIARFRQPEVDQLWLARHAHEDVARVHVSMDDLR